MFAADPYCAEQGLAHSRFNGLPGVNESSLPCSAGTCMSTWVAGGDGNGLGGAGGRQCLHPFSSSVHKNWVLGEHAFHGCWELGARPRQRTRTWPEPQDPRRRCSSTPFSGQEGRPREKGLSQGTQTKGLYIANTWLSLKPVDLLWTWMLTKTRRQFKCSVAPVWHSPVVLVWLFTCPASLLSDKLPDSGSSSSPPPPCLHQGLPLTRGRRNHQMHEGMNGWVDGKTLQRLVCLLRSTAVRSQNK